MAGVSARTQGQHIEVRPYLCGGMAAVVAEVVTFPLDTAKIRQQLQGQVGQRQWGGVRYRGTAHTLYTITTQEGLSRLYRGLSPAIMRQSVYGTIKFGLYYSSKDLAMRLVKQPQHKESGLINLCCAVLAGTVAASIANPTDVIKVRMQSGSNLQASSLPSVAWSIARNEGVRGLWRGVLPTAKRAALLAGVQLPMYDWTKARLVSLGVAEGTLCHFLASMLAGLSACMASNPVDVVRTRMMVQRRLAREEGPMYSSPYHTSAIKCGLHTVRCEGLTALYKGFIPAFARMGPWNIIFFCVYERLQRGH